MPEKILPIDHDLPKIGSTNLQMFIYKRDDERFIIIGVQSYLTAYPILEGFSDKDVIDFVNHREATQIRKRFGGTIINRKQERKLYIAPEHFIDNPDCYWIEQKKYDPKNISDIERDARLMLVRCGGQHATES